MAVQRIVNVALGGFSLDSLGGAATRQPPTIAASLMQAIRYYLTDRDSSRLGWRCPSFEGVGIEGVGQVGSMVEMELSVDGAVWSSLSQEARRQGVSTDRLLQHAALYFAAERDSGRLTQRIAEDLRRPPARTHVAPFGRNCIKFAPWQGENLMHLAGSLAVGPLGAAGGRRSGGQAVRRSLRRWARRRGPVGRT